MNFRSNYSTDTCLVYLTDYIKEHFNQTGMVLLDLQKAFDTVDHGILLNTLQANGFDSDAVSWLNGYILIGDKLWILLANSLIFGNQLWCFPGFTAWPLPNNLYNAFPYM